MLLVSISHGKEQKTELPGQEIADAFPKLRSAFGTPVL